MCGWLEFFVILVLLELTDLTLSQCRLYYMCTSDSAAFRYENYFDVILCTQWFGTFRKSDCFNWTKIDFLFSWTYRTQLPELKSSSKSSMSTNFVSFTKNVWDKKFSPIFLVMNGRVTFCVLPVAMISKDSQWNKEFSLTVSFRNQECVLCEAFFMPFFFVSTSDWLTPLTECVRPVHKTVIEFNLIFQSFVVIYSSCTLVVEERPLMLSPTPQWWTQT